MNDHTVCELREQSWRESCAKVERKRDALIDETIRLQDALNTARAEIEKLRAEVETRVAITNLHIKHQMEVDRELDDLKSLLASEKALSEALNNEVIELNALLVWSIKVEVTLEDGEIDWYGDGGRQRLPCDGTDAGIVNALREAKG